MNAKKPKNSGLIIHVPMELAWDIYRESGDLQFAVFPATMILIGTIGKALSTSYRENKKQLKPTILRRSRKAEISHEDLNVPTILTR